MTPLQEIEADLDWREAELATLRMLVSNTALREREQKVFFRAAWALLYAHYEGFFKFALTVYYDAISRSGKECGELPAKMQAFALTGQLRSLRNMAKQEIISAICNFQATHLKTAPKFPEIETRSNLWPAVLIELLCDADLELPSFDLHNRKLETLVRRRNKIAHGERDIISELSYYLKYEEAFTIVSYELVFAIEHRLNTL